MHLMDTINWQNAASRQGRVGALLAKIYHFRLDFRGSLDGISALFGAT
jgi:hypothetical protein